MALFEATEDYSSEDEESLHFREGDLITFEFSEGETWLGSLNGEVGRFPASCVRAAPPLPPLDQSNFLPWGPPKIIDSQNCLKQKKGNIEEGADWLRNQFQWIWRTGAFAGEFGDAFIRNTNLEGGDVGLSTKILNEVFKPVLERWERNEELWRGPLFDHPVVVEQLGNIFRLLDEAVEGDLAFQNTVLHSHLGQEFVDQLEKLLIQLKDLKKGQCKVIFGGWSYATKGHSIVYIVEKEESGKYAFVVCNTGRGTEFHPSSNANYPKEKKAVALRIGDIPAHRMLDEWLWYLIMKIKLTKHDTHLPDQLYQVILPHLMGNALGDPFVKKQMSEKKCGNYETLQRSGTCFFRCTLSAIRYLAKKEGMTVNQIKQLMFAIRVSFLERTRSHLVYLAESLQLDLSKLDSFSFSSSPNSDSSSSSSSSSSSQLIQQNLEPKTQEREYHKLPGGWLMSDLKMVLLACDQTGYAAVKLSKKKVISVTTLRWVNFLCTVTRYVARTIPLSNGILFKKKGMWKGVHLAIGGEEKQEEAEKEDEDEQRESVELAEMSLCPFSHFDLLGDSRSTNTLAGGPTEASPDIFVDLLPDSKNCSPSSSPPSLPALTKILKWTHAQCEKLRAKGALAGSSVCLHQICQLIEDIFSSAIPPLDLPQQPTVGEQLEKKEEEGKEETKSEEVLEDKSRSVWEEIEKMGIKATDQREFLKVLFELVLHYVSASYSLSLSRDQDGVRFVLVGSMVAYFDAVMRFSAIDEELLITKAVWNRLSPLSSASSSSPSAGSFANTVASSLDGEDKEQEQNQPPLDSPFWFSGTSFGGQTLEEIGSATILMSPHLQKLRHTLLSYFMNLPHEQPSRLMTWKPYRPKRRYERYIFTLTTKDGFMSLVSSLLTYLRLEEKLPVQRLRKGERRYQNYYLNKSPVERMCLWMCADVSQWEIHGVPELAYYRDLLFLFKLVSEPSEKLKIQNEGFQKPSVWFNSDFLPLWRFDKGDRITSTTAGFGVLILSQKQVFLGYKTQLNPLDPSLLLSSLSSTKKSSNDTNSSSSSSSKESTSSEKKKDDPKITEEFIRLCDNLQTFDNHLSEEDSETLLSYLTAPYLAAPLLLSFFASRNRVYSLVHPSLQSILEGALFLSRNFSSSPPGVYTIPVQSPKQLGTPYGLLHFELSTSPDSILQPLLSILLLSLQMCVSSSREFRGMCVELLLFVTRLSIHVNEYVQAIEEGFFGPLSSPFSPSSLQPFRKCLFEEVRPRLSHFSVASQKAHDFQSCLKFHSYLCLLHPFPSSDLSPFLVSASYVVAWHGGHDQPPQSSEDISPSSSSESDSSPDQDPTENESLPPPLLTTPPVRSAFWVIQKQRRSIVEWAENCSPAFLSRLLEVIVEISLQESVSFDLLSWILPTGPGGRSSLLLLDEQVDQIWESVSSKPIHCEKILESPHDYQPSTDYYETVRFPGASQIALFFDPNCSTEEEHDYITIYKDQTYTSTWGTQERYSGGSAAYWPGCNGRPPIIIPTDHFVLYFHSDALLEEWGYRIRAIAPVCSEKANILFHENNEKYPLHLCQRTLSVCLNDLGKSREFLKTSGQALLEEEALETEKTKKDLHKEKKGENWGLYRNAQGDIQVNLQSIEVYLSERAMAPTPPEIACHPNFRELFGSKRPYCAITSNQEHRTTLKIVDSTYLYSIEVWKPLEGINRAEVSASRVLDRFVGLDKENISSEEGVDMNTGGNGNGGRSGEEEMNEEGVTVKEGKVALGALDGGYDPDGCINIPGIVEEEPGRLFFCGKEYEKYQSERAGWLGPFFDELLDETIATCQIEDNILIWQRKDSPLDLIYYCPASSGGDHGSNNPGMFYQLVTLNERRAFVVFALIEVGRKAQRQMVFASNIRLSLCYISTFEEERETPMVVGAEQSGGCLFGLLYDPSKGPLDNIPSGNQIGSMRVKRTRNQLFDPYDYAFLFDFFTESDEEMEEFCPPEMLTGLLPEAIVDGFQFWRTGEKCLRGYPRSSSSFSSWWAGFFLFVRLLDWREGISGTSVVVIRVRLTSSSSPVPILSSIGSRSSMDMRESMGESGKSFGMVEPMVLHHPLGAPPHSTLGKIGETMTQLDSYSHVLFWAEIPIPEEGAINWPDSLHSLPVTHIELPRIQARFFVECSPSSSSISSSSPTCSPPLPSSALSRVITIHSQDHDGWLVDLDESSKTESYLSTFTNAIPHYLVLKNRFSEIALMIPNFGLFRSEITSAPFSTTKWTDRSASWYSKVQTRFYIYPLHMSGTFLRTGSLAGALYLFVVRLFHREYVAAASLLPSCETDSVLTSEEIWILSLIKGTVHDHHPDAHAVRLRMALICYESGAVPVPWHTTEIVGVTCVVRDDYTQYLTKYLHVASQSRMSLNEEQTLLAHLRDNLPVNLQRRCAYTSAVQGDPGRGAKSRQLQLPTYPPLQIGQTMTNLVRRVRVFHQPDRLKKISMEHFYIKYNRPSPEQLSGGELLSLLQIFYDDDMYGYSKCIGFLFFYEVLSGRLPVRLLDFSPDQPDEEVWECSVCTKMCKQNTCDCGARRCLQCTFCNVDPDSTQCIVCETPLHKSEPKDERTPPYLSMVSLLLRSMFVHFMNDPTRRGIEEKYYCMLFTLIPFAAANRQDEFPVLPHDEAQPNLGTKGIRFDAEELGGFGEKLKEFVLKADAENAPLAHPTRALVGHTLLKTPTPPTPISSRPSFTDNARGMRSLRPMKSMFPEYFRALQVTEKDVEYFSSAPLSPIDLSVDVAWFPYLIPEDYCSDLPFDLSSHSCVQSFNGKARLDLLRKDMNDSYEMLGKFAQPFLTCMTPSVVQTLMKCGTEPNDLIRREEILQNAEMQVDQLLRRLVEFQRQEQKILRRGIREAEGLANIIVDPLKDESGADLYRDQIEFAILRRSKLFTTFHFENLCGALMSSESLADLKRYNPFFEAQREEELMCAVGGVLCRSVRLNQLNRCISRLSSLQNDLSEIRKNFPKFPLSLAGKARIELLMHSATSVASELSSQRHYMSIDKSNGEAMYDPRFLVFEFSSGFLLKKRQVDLVLDFVNAHEQGSSLVRQMIMGAGKTTVISPLLSLLLADGHSLVMAVVPSALLDQSKSVFRNCFGHVVNKRVYTFQFERSLLCENLDHLKLLFQKLDLARATRSIVCTTPEALKCLMLKYLDLLQAVDDAHPLVFLPRNLIPTDVAKKLSLESIAKSHHNQELAADAIRDILSLLGPAPKEKRKGKKRKGGIALIDEVDMVLHTLRSETNFPIGQQGLLELHPQRWEAAIHMIDTLFYRITGRVTLSNFHPRDNTLKYLRDISAMIEKGEKLSALQRSPHTVLVQRQFYDSEMKGLMAKWAVVWLEKQAVFVEGVISASESPTWVAKEREGEKAEENAEEGEMMGPFSKTKVMEMVEIFLTTQIPPTPVGQVVQKHFKPLGIQYLNLMRDWVISFLPFCMTKINRVSYGLLQPRDLFRWETSVREKMPSSRLKLAVPFIGKDVPSEASEFSNPEVLIALTVFAYRYEGLRLSDLKVLIQTLRRQMNEELGSFVDRPSRILFDEWIKLALQQKEKEKSEDKKRKMEEVGEEENEDSENSESEGDQGDEKEDSQREKGQKEERRGEDDVILSLEFLQVEDPEQLRAVGRLLTPIPEVIEYYLCEIVFPEVLQHQPAKLQASGYDLGSDILFGTRLGFSGTPSLLVPRNLQCAFEKGDDSKMIRVLTSTETVSIQLLPQWSVSSLLQLIASQGFQAFIDTGALITGLTNKQVARYLLAHGLEGLDACVYLDEKDRPMVLDRTGAPPVPLNRSGVRVEKRFTFYDQVHSTGIDIKQAIDAKAVVTLGKDMTLRDYAQGCWRMRGLDCGQRVHVLIVSEVGELITVVSNTGKPLVDICAWLMVNSLQSEELQFMQLCQQEIAYQWRKSALLELTQTKASSIQQPSAKEEPAQKESSASSSPFLKTRFVNSLNEQEVEGIEIKYSSLLGFPEKSDQNKSEEMILEEGDGRKLPKDDSRAILNKLIEQLGGYDNPALSEIGFNLIHVDEIPEETRHFWIEVLGASIANRESKSPEEENEEEQSNDPLEIEDEIQEEVFSYGSKRLRQCIRVFKEPLGHTVPTTIPRNIPFVDKMRFLVQNHKQFVSSPQQKEQIAGVLSELELVDREAIGRERESDYNREMVQQQEQQKEKQMQVTSEKLQIEFSEKSVPLLTWSIYSLSPSALTTSPSSSSPICDKNIIFSPLRSFQFKHKSNELPFPKDLLLSQNHTPLLHRSDLPRRLKNIYILVFWREKTLSSNSSSQAPPFYSAVLTLTEGESLRRAIVNGHFPDLFIFLVTSSGLPLTPLHLFAPSLSSDVKEHLQCARFLNCETDYTDEDMALLLKVLSGVAKSTRRNFYEDVMIGRRRSRLRWQGTSLARVFSFSDEASFLKLREMTRKVREAFFNKFSTLLEVFQAFDLNNDGLLSREEVKKGLASLDIAVDLENSNFIDVMFCTDHNSDGYLNLRDFTAHFALTDTHDDHQATASPVPLHRLLRNQSEASSESELISSDVRLLEILAMVSGVSSAHQTQGGGKRAPHHLKEKSSHQKKLMVHLHLKNLKTLGQLMLVSEGHALFTSDGVATTPGDHSCIAFQGVALTSGRHYFELEVIRKGNGCIGWAGPLYRGEGVGEDTHSFGLCQNGRLRTHGQFIDSPQLPRWEAGDVICCSLDADDQLIQFAINGQWGECAVFPKEFLFEKVNVFSPMVSFEYGFKFRMNSGSMKFRFPLPNSYRSVYKWIRHRMSEMYAMEAGENYAKLIPVNSKQEVSLKKWRISADHSYIQRLRDAEKREGYGRRHVFPSLRLQGVLLTSGRWYYEVKIINPGIAQIGWVDLDFWATSKEGLGVGDGKHGWAYDGQRRMVWSNRSEGWGLGWKHGDIVGVLCDLTERTLSYSLNGSFAKPMGVAFRNLNYVGGLIPALTLQGGFHDFSCTIFLGDKDGPLKYPSSGYRPVWEAVEEFRPQLLPSLQQSQEAAEKNSQSQNSDVVSVDYEMEKESDEDDGEDNDSFFSNTSLSHSQMAAPLPLLPTVVLSVTSGFSYANIERSAKEKTFTVSAAQFYPSFVADRCLLTEGVWYYEVTFQPDLTQGPSETSRFCVGWGTKGFFGDAVEGKGVGDDVYSWGIDDSGYFKHDSLSILAEGFEEEREKEKEKERREKEGEREREREEREKKEREEREKKEREEKEKEEREKKEREEREKKEREEEKRKEEGEKEEGIKEEKREGEGEEEDEEEEGKKEEEKKEEEKKEEEQKKEKKEEEQKKEKEKKEKQEKKEKEQEGEIVCSDYCVGVVGCLADLEKRKLIFYGQVVRETREKKKKEEKEEENKKEEEKEKENKKEMIILHEVSLPPDIKHLFPSLSIKGDTCITHKLDINFGWAGPDSFLLSSLPSLPSSLHSWLEKSQFSSFS